MKEIKVITRNGKDCHIELSDYPDINTIKCRVINIGDEIIPTGFYYDGSPRFSYDTFDKYSNGDKYADIYVEVTYEPKELELDKNIFDTKDGLNNYIVDLDTLNKVIDIRKIAYKKKNMKLTEFIWRSYLKLDSFGQVLTLSELEFIDDCPLWVKEQCVHTIMFNNYCKNWSGSFSGNIPESNEICPECGEKWYLDNVKDYTTINENREIIGYHKDCLKNKLDRNQLDEFKDIFSKVYNISELKFEAIPNGYWNSYNSPSWFIVSTPDGDIEIGWRKRVINIQWLDNYKIFTEVFKNEDVTRGFNQYDKDRYIHAWNKEKAVEYIRRANESIYD